MAMRFRRSVKVAPGVKVNLNKKSMGVTVGTKGAHYSVNSSGTKTSSVGIPGTGVSYVNSSGKKSQNSGGSAEAPLWPKYTYIILLILAILLAIFSIALLFVAPVFGVIMLIITAICLINSIHGLRRHKAK